MATGKRVAVSTQQGTASPGNNGTLHLPLNDCGHHAHDDAQVPLNPASTVQVIQFVHPNDNVAGVISQYHWRRRQAVFLPVATICLLWLVVVGVAPTMTMSGIVWTDHATRTVFWLSSLLLWLPGNTNIQSLAVPQTPPPPRVSFILPWGGDDDDLDSLELNPYYYNSAFWKKTSRTKDRQESSSSSSSSFYESAGAAVGALILLHSLGSMCGWLEEQVIRDEERLSSNVPTKCPLRVVATTTTKTTNAATPADRPNAGVGQVPQRRRCMVHRTRLV